MDQSPPPLTLDTLIRLVTEAKADGVAGDSLVILGGEFGLFPAHEGNVQVWPARPGDRERQGEPEWELHTAREHKDWPKHLVIW